jgi:hypothetical protein
MLLSARPAELESGGSAEDRPDDPELAARITSHRSVLTRVDALLSSIDARYGVHPTAGKNIE